MKDRPDLNALLKTAVEAWNAMPPDQKLEHREAQRKSWVVGELMIEHPEMSRDAAEQIYYAVKRGEVT